jgi:hypothetical protein
MQSHHQLVLNCLEVADQLDGVLVSNDLLKRRPYPLVLNLLVILKLLLPKAEAALEKLGPRVEGARGVTPFRSHGKTFTSAHAAAVNLAGAILRAADIAIDDIVHIYGGRLTTKDALTECLGKRFGKMRIPSWQRAWAAYRNRYLRARPHFDESEVRAGMNLEFSLPATPPAVIDGEWLPASEAVERAEQKGYRITLSWLTRNAQASGVRVRSRQGPGTHKKEVEWGSLIVWLVDHKKPDRNLQQAREGCGQEEAAKRIKEARARKRQERPLD